MFFSVYPHTLASAIDQCILVPIPTLKSQGTGRLPSSDHDVYRWRNVRLREVSAEGRQEDCSGSRGAECSPPEGDLQQPSGSTPAAARHAGGSGPRGGAARRGSGSMIGPSPPRSPAPGPLFFSVAPPPPPGSGGGGGRSLG